MKGREPSVSLRIQFSSIQFCSGSHQQINHTTCDPVHVLKHTRDQQDDDDDVDTGDEMEAKGGYSRLLINAADWLEFG